MLRETRKLFQYILKYPSTQWRSFEGGHVLDIPGMNNSTITIWVDKDNYKVERSHGSTKIMCDKAEWPDMRSWEVHNLTKLQAKKDMALVKEVSKQAHGSNSNIYAAEVAYITAGRKSRLLSTKSAPDDTNRHL